MSVAIPGRILASAGIRLVHEPLPANLVVSGTPTTATAVLDAYGDYEIGVWEMTQGVSRDTETDEVFIVLSGRARVDFEDSDAAPLELRTGSVIRLAEGARTIWTVSETLRKVYIA